MLLQLIYVVRMAERSKAPDSSVNLLGVLVSNGGVGSNPTSDKILYIMNMTGYPKKDNL